MENPAEYRIAWANEVVYMCEGHFKQLMEIGNAMGWPARGEKCEKGHVCKNCENEAKKRLWLWRWL